MSLNSWRLLEQLGRLLSPDSLVRAGKKSRYVVGLSGMSLIILRECQITAAERNHQKKAPKGF